MFGPPGRLYVYRSYGIHVCANVVCEAKGRGAAVLLRALEPLAGVARMRRARGLPPGAPAREIAGGPGRLAQAFGIELEDYGASVLRGRFALRAAAPGCSDLRVVQSPRIGLSRGRELRYRFYAAGHPCVSRTRPG
jgi:DNA-3-methyladenine glycosylase